MKTKNDKLKILSNISDELLKSLVSCNICPRHCGVDRLSGKLGFCKAPLDAKIFSYQSHFGEEPPISGTNGSGAIFFSGCNLRCVYCQNYKFSQTISGKSYTPESLAGIMLELESKGSHNINLVTPTPYIPQIVKALEIATRRGLDIPIVYNTSGYEDPLILKKLDGIVDIYLADIRYSKSAGSKLYSAAEDYFIFCKNAVKEMQKQVSGLKINSSGIAQKGLIIRILVFPGDAGGLEDIFKFISQEISNETYISLLSQYFPTHNANQFSRINRHITSNEYNKAVALLEKYNLSNGWVQEYRSSLDMHFAGPYIKKRKDIK